MGVRNECEATLPDLAGGTRLDHMAGLACGRRLGNLAGLARVSNDIQLNSLFNLLPVTNKEFNELFRKRTLLFAIAVLRFIESVPFNGATRVMIYQLTKSSTSIGANYRAFCRARSKNERFSKICIVVEEADETQYWLEIFDETDYGNKELLTPLIIEISDIVKVTTSIKNSMFT